MEQLKAHVECQQKVHQFENKAKIAFCMQIILVISRRKCGWLRTHGLRSTTNLIIKWMDTCFRNDASIRRSFLSPSVQVVPFPKSILALLIVFSEVAEKYEDKCNLLHTCKRIVVCFVC